MDPLVVDPPDLCSDVGLGKVRSMLWLEDAPGTHSGSFRINFILVSGMDLGGLGLVLGLGTVGGGGPLGHKAMKM